MVRRPRGIGYNELSDALKLRIDLGGDGGNGVLVNITPEYEYSVTYNMQDVIQNIEFVDGIEIVTFDPTKDSLAVYKDGVRLAEGIDYVINENGISIDSLKGGWIITEDVNTVFTFVQKKNSTAGMGVGIATDEEIYALFGIDPPQTT